MSENSNDVGEEYYRTHLCEFCKSKNLLILILAIAEKINASIGALVIRKNKITWDETRRQYYVINACERLKKIRFVLKTRDHS
ncbi:MAG TPA: hypothetical protein VFY68_05495 [Nitrososphaeraceae archaeon]|nr:hypothetical protein [Nitrososphaeraceae archaeon]